MKTEFEFINSLRAKSELRIPNSKLRVGIGDDCAVVSKDSKTDLVITTDLLVEDVDFRLDWSTPQFIGHKALAVSLSDIAAMGANPVWALVSIGVPEKIWQSDFAEQFYAGWLKLAAKFKVELAGGDISRTPDKIVIDSIVAGEIKKNHAVLRSGAQVGDWIFVTGELGGAATGLKLLENNTNYKNLSISPNALLSRQLTPLPQVKSGQILANRNLASAMIDISDGLSSDLNHLCAASGVGARIAQNTVPIDRRLKNYKKYSALKKFELDIFSLALNGGEDYELIFTINPKNIKKLKKHLPDVSQIGQIVEQNQGVTIFSDLQVVPLLAEGFRHF